MNRMWRCGLDTFWKIISSSILNSGNMSWNLCSNEKLAMKHRAPCCCTTNMRFLKSSRSFSVSFICIRLRNTCLYSICICIVKFSICFPVISFIVEHDVHFAGPKAKQIINMVHLLILRGLKCNLFRNDSMIWYI